MFYSSRLRPLTRESAYAPASPHHLATVCFKKICHLHSTLIFFASPSAADAGIGVRTCFASSFDIHRFQKSTSYRIPLAFFKNSTAHGCADFAEREFAPSLSLRREFSCCEKTRRFFTTILPSAADAGIGVRACFASSFGNHMFQNNTSYFIPL